MLTLDVPQGHTEVTTVGRGLAVASVGTEDGQRVVHLTGEFDMASRDVAYRACISCGDVAVVVDVADVTFMDCSGYGALVEARLILERLGGSLTLRGQSGEPARLLSLLSNQ